MYDNNNKEIRCLEAMNPPQKKRRKISFMSSLTDTLIAPNENNNQSNNQSITPLQKQEIKLYMEFHLSQFYETIIREYETDPLIFWQSHQKLFPILSQVVPNILVKCGGSHSAESCFSIAGNVLSDERSQITPQNVSDIVF